MSGSCPMDTSDNVKCALRGVIHRPKVLGQVIPVDSDIV